MSIRLLVAAVVLTAACSPKRSGPGLGDGSLMVSMNDALSWPPVGDRCDLAVSCCEAMWQVDGGMELVCKLGASSHLASGAASCDALITSTQALYRERGNRNLPDVSPVSTP